METNGDFKKLQRENMIIWRESNISTQEKGFQNGNSYDHVIPGRIWKENLWNGIRVTLPQYLEDEAIQPHTGKNNLLSSWVNCANLYFPIRNNESLKQLMLGFLQQNISDQITEITEVELEFAFKKGDSLHPSILLGEQDGNRGSGQTSPDVAFRVKTKGGKGLILTECKYTEHSFYSCSARRKEDKGDKKGNKHPERCMLVANECDYKSVCHQTVWGRKYLDIITFSNNLITKLKRCPAATAGYQLLRQQALAEGIAIDKSFNLVASTVAFDERNYALIGCLRTTGVENFQKGWGELFDGKAIFKTWTHQEWVEFVRTNQKNDEFKDWLSYLNERYNY